jgi:MtaA/CmuA family methyltransferase
MRSSGERETVVSAPTSLERARRAIRGEPVDRVPVIPILHYGTARLVGATIGEFATDAGVMVKSLIAGQRRYGYDGIQSSLSVAVEAEALGSETVQPADAVPYVVRPLIQEPRDLLRLKVPDPRRDGRLPLFLDAMARLSREVGSELYLIATIRGPLNLASQLRGVEQVMLDLSDDPAFVRDLLDFAVAVGEVFGGALSEAGANAIAVGEALCSPAFISPRTYRAFVQTRHHVLIGRLRARGAETTLLHVCGDIRPIIPDLAATGVDVIDLDWQVDPAEADRLAAGKLALRGNLDPSAVLLQGTREEVLAKAAEAIDRASGSRFILSSGCDVAPTTSPENVAALVEAARAAAERTRG